MSDRWDPRPPAGRGASRSAAPPPPAPRPPSNPGGSARGPSRWSTGSWSRGSARPARDAPARTPRPRQTGTFAVGPGYPWPVVAAGAVVVTGVLAWLLLHRAGLLGLMFPVGYLVVCMLGVAMVRAEAVAVPALSAPVVAFLGLVIAAIITGDTASTSLFFLGVFAPMAELFWWMVVATAACLVVGFLRFRQVRPGWSPREALRGSGAA